MDMLRGVHVPSDGRGNRKVLLNGKELRNVVYADTERGVVRFFDEPPKMHKRKRRIITRTRHGVVEVYQQ